MYNLKAGIFFLIACVSFCTSCSLLSCEICVDNASCEFAIPFRGDPMCIVKTEIPMRSVQFVVKSKRSCKATKGLQKGENQFVIIVLIKILLEKTNTNLEQLKFKGSSPTRSHSNSQLAMNTSTQRALLTSKQVPTIIPTQYNSRNPRLWVYYQPDTTTKKLQTNKFTTVPSLTTLKPDNNKRPVNITLVPFFYKFPVIDEVPVTLNVQEATPRAKTTSPFGFTTAFANESRSSALKKSTPTYPSPLSTRSLNAPSLETSLPPTPDTRNLQSRAQFLTPSSKSTRISDTTLEENQLRKPGLIFFDTEPVTFSSLKSTSTLGTTRRAVEGPLITGKRITGYVNATSKSIAMSVKPKISRNCIGSRRKKLINTSKIYSETSTIPTYPNRDTIKKGLESTLESKVLIEDRNHSNIRSPPQYEQRFNTDLSFNLSNSTRKFANKTPLINMSSNSSVINKIFSFNMSITTNMTFTCPALEYREDDTTLLFRNLCRNRILVKRLMKKSQSKILSMLDLLNPTNSMDEQCEYVMFLKHNCLSKKR